MEQKLKHLEMIQGVINRLSTNSFLLKGWSVVLVAALFALAAPESRAAFVYLAYISAFVLWGLDGYFLWPVPFPGRGRQCARITERSLSRAGVRGSVGPRAPMFKTH